MDKGELVVKELEHILKEEGFEPKPYQDHLGNWTFGHGLTWISEEESKTIARGRYSTNIHALVLHIEFLNTRPFEVLEILGHMSYQLGVSGVLGFKKMIAAIKDEDYAAAADEMIDSKWAKQTPERANRLAERMRNIS